MAEKKIWAGLIHLGTNMWPKSFSDFKDFPNEEPGSRLFFDEKVWREVTEAMSAAKMNAIVIDLAEGVRYPSHPELAVPGSWTPEKLRTELVRLRTLGLEPIPKQNFSAGHDAWLGEYSRMVSTPDYYRVCRDLIRDVAEIFDRPRLFHMGYDEETESVQKHQEICVIRQGSLWWHDFNFFVKEITSHGMRPWMWSDYAWGHPDDFFKRMTKEVIQSVWYYGSTYDVAKMRETDSQERYWKTKILTYDKLDAAGFDQIPCGSNFSNDVNFGLTVDYCSAHINPERLKGFLMASWFFTTKSFREKHLQSISQVAAAISKKGQ